MNDLTQELLQLTRHNKDGGFATQKNRQSGLLAMANQLHDLGYKLKSASALKPKHVQALVETWQDKDHAQATIRNRLSWLRWWAEKINKAPVIERTNKAYGANQRSTGKLNRAQEFDLQKFEQIDCDYVKASLLLQSAFGLRREEAIKFDPKYAMRHGYIRLKASWTKGGRYREIPISNEHQHKALIAVKEVAQKDALIPRQFNYKQQLKRYEYQTSKVGWCNTHGLRHAYAQRRYETLTKTKCPLQGGKLWQDMTREEQKTDRNARKVIAEELGHSRISICDVYLGKVRS